MDKKGLLFMWISFKTSILSGVITSYSIHYTKLYDYSGNACKNTCWFCICLVIKLNCGERGIRTPGTLRYNGFQDRRIRPLCHLSITVWLSSKAHRCWATQCLLVSKTDAKVEYYFEEKNICAKKVLKK